MESIDICTPARHLATRPKSSRLHIFDAGGDTMLLDVENGLVCPLPAPHASLLQSTLSAGDVGRADTAALAMGFIAAKSHQTAIPQSVPVKALSIAVAQKCNLGCSYCYAQQGTFGGEAANMSFEVARNSIDLLLADAAPGEPVTLAFMGGEPLANRRLIHASTNYAAQQASERGIPIGFSMTTNGTLISPDDIALFQQFGFTLTISIDGVSAVNDRLRPLRSGRGSFALVDRGVRSLLALSDRRYSVAARVTVTPFNLNLVETLSGLESMGFEAIMFSPLLNAPSGKAQMEADDLDLLLDQLILCGEAFRSALNSGRVLPFANLIKTVKRIHAYERDQYPCGAGGSYMSVSAGGGLYACHRFVNDDDGALGDLDGGIDVAKRVQWLASRHLNSQTPCNGCWARYLCSGSCHYEAIKRGRPACDYIRGWLHYCLAFYAELASTKPHLLAQVLRA